MSNPMAHLYFGDGVGKTTAAVGLCVRAIGAGKKVLFVCFLKDGTSAEVASLAILGADVRCAGGGKFWFEMDENERALETQRVQRVFSYVEQSADAFDVVVLDEALDAVELGIIELERLLTFVEGRAQDVVVTGHSANERIIESFGYVTRMQKLKHPFDEGMQARRGIEY